jgi:hypothetical protein
MNNDILLVLGGNTVLVNGCTETKCTIQCYDVLLTQDRFYHRLSKILVWFQTLQKNSWYEEKAGHSPVSIPDDANKAERSEERK